MKFARQLEEYHIPEWRRHYLRYTFFTDRLEKIRSLASGNCACSALEGSSAQWLAELEADARRTGEFAQWTRQGLGDKIQGLVGISDSIRIERSRPSTSPVAPLPASLPLLADPSSPAMACPRQRAAASKHEELRLLQALGRASRELTKLRSFMELNHCALFKILKKHDKYTKLSSGLGQFSRLLAESGLSDVLPLEALDAKLLQIASSSSSYDGVGLISVRTLQLMAGLSGEAAVTTHGGMRERFGDSVLSFFIGSSVAFLFSIIVLIALPYQVDAERPFSITYFLAPFPIFRFSASVTLMLWGLGAVARSCEESGINHLFLLDVEPRCRVGAKYFFARAAALTTILTFLFGMYVVDYKWEIIPPVDAERGYNMRSSRHYMLYPLTMLVVVFIILCWPTALCRTTYWCSFLKCIGRTIAAPLYAIAFCDNIVGDVLTSLAKPLQDIPPVFCYLFSSHPQTSQEVARFMAQGDVCPSFFHYAVKPIIAALPFVFRTLQCGRRYYDTKESRHLLNLGKYVASLLVVIVSAGKNFSTASVIFVSLIATAYAFIWDVTLDWGLERADVFRCTKRNGNNSLEQHGMFFGTQRLQPNKVSRIFTPTLYVTCSFVDLLARLTWVNTLVPVTIITNNIVQREVILFVITAIEIARRSMWSVLRIEYEQVANAGGFRSLLWVPDRVISECHLPERGQELVGWGYSLRRLRFWVLGRLRPGRLRLLLQRCKQSVRTHELRLKHLQLLLGVVGLLMPVGRWLFEKPKT